jgi:hypothetical protein
MLEKHVASRQLEAAHQTLGIIKPEESEKEAPKTIAELAAKYVNKEKSPSLSLSTTAIRHYESPAP